MRKCEKLFINPGSEGSSGSRSSNSGSATANALEEEEANNIHMRTQHMSDMTCGTVGSSTMIGDSMLLTNSTCNQSTLQFGTILSPSPADNSAYASPPDVCNFQQSFTQSPTRSRPKPEEETKNESQGMSVLQRLQKEGLFNFKNVPEKKPVSRSAVKKRLPIVAADAAYGNFTQTTSFIDDKSGNSSSPTF